MLSTKAVEPATLVLLKKIQSIPDFKTLRLVGGTALALQYGHRRSIDLDFFGNVDFTKLNFPHLLSGFAQVRIINNSTHIKEYFIDGIKVDFVNTPYKWIRPAITHKDFIIASPEDIAAMKLAAVTNRGSRKDFIDIYYLLQKYSLADMLSFYQEKYPDGSKFLVLKSLVYFEDADSEEMPGMFEDISWAAIKNSITQRHAEFLA